MEEEKEESESSSTVEEYTPKSLGQKVRSPAHTHVLNVGNMVQKKMPDNDSDVPQDE